MRRLDVKTTVTRREHQIRALTSLSGHYGGGGRRAQLHWECGTGKTYVGRWTDPEGRTLPWCGGLIPDPTEANG